MAWAVTAMEGAVTVMTAVCYNGMGGDRDRMGGDGDGRGGCLLGVQMYTRFIS